MPHRLIFLNTLKALNAGEYIVQEDEGRFFMNSQPNVHLVKDLLIRHRCLFEIKKDDFTGFTYYRLSFYGDMELQKGKRWWRSLSLLEKINLRFLVGF